jgi:hypothetical protein
LQLPADNLRGGPLVEGREQRAQHDWSICQYEAEIPTLPAADQPTSTLEGLLTESTLYLWLVSLHDLQFGWFVYLELGAISRCRGI